jgi:hypothetical protein
MFNKNILYFQHNHRKITEEDYNYMIAYKRELLKNIGNLLDKLGIKYVISHGNLLEYTRGTPIYQDDDIDIRYDINDLDKWLEYCKSLTKCSDIENNLTILRKIMGLGPFKKMYIIKLRHFQYEHKVPFNFKIWCDFIANDINIGTFGRYDVFQEELRKIQYLGVDTYVPNQILTEKLLSDEYGNNYIIPKYDYKKYSNLLWIK